MSKVRIGVLSVAKIGVEKVIPATQRLCKRAEVTAIASRSLEKAQQFAQKLGIRRAHGSYEALLNDPEVDLVYNPLPNSMHVSWSIRALEAGKHVLCEKPIALTVAEAQTLADAGKRHPKLKLTEAFMYRHHPQWITARRMVREGEIGDLTAIQTMFSYYNVDPQNIRNRPDVGGGGLLDIGCYPISLSRWIFESEPRRVFGKIEMDSRLGTDHLGTAILEFDRGISSFVIGTQLNPYQRVHIAGTKGRIEIEIPFNAPSDRPCRMWHDQKGDIREIILEQCDQYALQSDAVADAILDNRPVDSPIEDAVNNMRVIEAVARASQSGNWEVP